MNIAASGTIGIIAAAGLTFLAGCDDTEGTIGASAPIARPVKVATAQQKADEISRVYPGFVNANDSVRLSFEVAGRLVEYPVANGSSLQAGDLIGRIDPRDYQNQVDAARALVTAARAKLERMRRAHEKNAVSGIEVIEQQAVLASAVARLNITQKALDDTELRAPYDGVVARTLTSSFAEVAAGQGVVLFESEDVIELEISIPEQDIVHASESNPGRFLATFDSLPGRSFPLTFKEVDTQGDSVTQTYRVGLTMPSPEDVHILPGMTAEVTWSRPSLDASSGVLVPASALFATPNGDTHVWVINRDSMIVSKRHVRQGGIAEGAMATILDGLEPGEMVASAGVNHLDDGVTVRLLNPTRLSASDR
ncbi:MAG: efflux RND transporter periplasmic adaptor subunit [Phycisphaerales bacterium]|jgi:multidrug efflux system membrane fusion protein